MRVFLPHVDSASRSEDDCKVPATTTNNNNSNSNSKSKKRRIRMGVDRDRIHDHHDAQAREAAEFSVEDHDNESLDCMENLDGRITLHMNNGKKQSQAKVDPATISLEDPTDELCLDRFATLLRTKHVPPLEIEPMQGDGNCLFRAIALQVYGSQDMHLTVRAQCMDFMEREDDHYSHFVADERYTDYIARKRQPGVHGNHTEIQAISELYNRNVLVYVPTSGILPINIFQHASDTAKNDSVNSGVRDTNQLEDYYPIRLLYMDGNHYDALIDPLVPTAGLGLGLPGLKPGLADKMMLERVKCESNRSMQDTMDEKLKLALEESKKMYLEEEEGELGRAIKESCMDQNWKRIEEEEDAFEKKAMYLSEIDAADFDLEQAVLKSSLESYRKAEQESKQPSSSSRRSEGGGRRNRYNTSPNCATSRSQRSTSSSPIHRTATALSSNTEPVNCTATLSFSPSYYSSPYLYSTASTAAAASSSVASFPCARSSSPDANEHSNFTTGATTLASTANITDEYPPSVQELVMNGFELSKVLHAYDLIGDNFDDLLSFLLSSTS